jgi:hypothetical protein
MERTARTPWRSSKDAQLFLAAWFCRWDDIVTLLQKSWLSRPADPHVYVKTCDDEKMAHIAAPFGHSQEQQLKILFKEIRRNRRAVERRHVIKRRRCSSG